MLYGVGQAILAVGALSIGEKKHMEPVRIMMIADEDNLRMKPLGFICGHLPDSNWDWRHQTLRGRLRSRPVQVAPAGQGPRHLLCHVLRLDQHWQHGVHHSSAIPQESALLR